MHLPFIPVIFHTGSCSNTGSGLIPRQPNSSRETVYVKYGVEISYTHCESEKGKRIVTVQPSIFHRNSFSRKVSLVKVSLIRLLRLFCVVCKVSLLKNTWRSCRTICRCVCLTWHTTKFPILAIIR